jgi:hypothetical protein
MSHVSDPTRAVPPDFLAHSQALIVPRYRTLQIPTELQRWLDFVVAHFYSTSFLIDIATLTSL